MLVRITSRLFGIFAASLAALAVTPAVAAAADSTPPAVSITHPGPGGHAWGTTVVGADAQDATGVARVEFRVDGTLAGTDTSAPFELRWNTSGLAVGSGHQLSARAVDSAGNAATTDTVAVTISRTLSVGSSVTSTGINGDAAYRSAFLTRFGSLTPETEMKMDALQPQQGVFNFSAADQMVSFAAKNGKQLRGHTLVWGSALPGWLTSRSWTRDQLLSILRNHVQTVVTHFRGQVKEWDVVNEAWNWDGSWRQNFWYQAIGPEYVEDAFRWAHEADPDAKLFYNDYSAERVSTKSDDIYSMLADFKSRGVPVDGIGFQAHAWKDWVASATSLRSNLQRFAALGLEIEFTEMDLKSSELTGLTLDDRRRQAAEIYRRYASACQDIVACKRLTVWAVGDAASWLGPAEEPVLLDGVYAPKPAWTAVADELAIGTGPAVPPETSLAGGRTGTTNARDAAFTFSSTDPRAVFECRLNSGAWSACSSPKSYSGLADGSYTFEVRSKDLSANPDPTPASRAWTVDTAAPAPAIGAPASGAVLTDFSPDASGTAGTAAGDERSISLSVYAGSAASGTPVRVVPAAVSAGTWMVTIAPDLAAGTYTVVAEQRDAAGNVGRSAPVTITIQAPPADPPAPPPPGDTTPPPGDTTAGSGETTPPSGDTTSGSGDTTTTGSGGTTTTGSGDNSTATTGGSATAPTGTTTSSSSGAASTPAGTSTTTVDGSTNVTTTATGTPADRPAELAAPATLLLPAPTASASPRLRAASTNLRKLVRHGLAVRLSRLAGTRARLQLWITSSTARRLGLRARRTLLGTVNVQVSNGTAQATLRIGRRFRGRVAAQSRVAFSLVLTTAGKSYRLPLLIRR